MGTRRYFAAVALGIYSYAPGGDLMFLMLFTSLPQAKYLAPLALTKLCEVLFSIAAKGIIYRIGGIIYIIHYQQYMSNSKLNSVFVVIIMERLVSDTFEKCLILFLFSRSLFGHFLEGLLC